jgi:hypothetical protein
VHDVGITHQGRRPLQRHAGGDKSLDHQVVQVTGDPVAVLEQRQALGVPAVLGELNPDARLRREGGHHLHRGWRERKRPPMAPGGQHTAHVTGRAERHEHGRAQRHMLAGYRGGPCVSAEVLHGERFAAGHHNPGGRSFGRQHQPEGLGGAVSAGSGRESWLSTGYTWASRHATP